ncbi:MAG TPA: multidrug ABC transporter ATP-binding protein [Candidatus Latescibacteria bacterium]|nr:multidrug ABC transporter ATP-binding protein [Gemmatimonadota bacterium]HCR18117.1 multidrug ABC transporter ATP-binding protein [Candidatus Latescibacterota bacterium]|tara:strand:- start:517 stop:1260 length:744 start_codon:yes stop_codon:yes gene_type:complete
MVESTAITKYYGHIKAVEDISFTLGTDEIVGFVGPNGAGKSTVLKMLSTFIYPTSGGITVDGLDVVEHSLEIRRRIGYLSGDTPLYQEMRVDRFLRFVGQARGLRGVSLKRQFSWVVGVTGLEDVLMKRVNQCSTGFRQRIGLATALIHDPPILLLDEPTHGFDPIQVRAFRDTLKELSPNRVILFSTHIISEVAALSDRVLIINEGCLLADGTPTELSRSTDIEEDNLEGIFAHLVRQAEEERSIA